MAGKRRGKGEGSVFKDKDGYWNAQIDLGYVGGKCHYRRIRRKTRKEAIDTLQELFSQQRQGINIAPERHTVKTYLETWLEEHVKCYNRPRTYDKYADDIRHHIFPHIGAYQLAKLTPEHIQKMLNALSSAGLSPRSVSNIRAMLRRALNQALRWG